MVFVKLYRKDVLKNSEVGLLKLLKKEKLKYSILEKKKLKLQNLFVFKILIRGYNFKMRLKNKLKFLKLELGYPLPWSVRIPQGIFIKKIKRRFFLFFSFNSFLLKKFIFFLKNIRNKSMPYRHKGFVLKFDRDFSIRKVGKRSKR